MSTTASAPASPDAALTTTTAPGFARAGRLVATMFRRGPAQRTLHLTWLAFFLSFVVWFNFAPFASTIGKQFGLDKGQLVTLGLCNLALTVPARLVIGGLLDRFGPRRTFSAILIYAAVPCFLFATAQSFGMLVVSRLMIGVVGAGFVVGIRMVSEWFPPAKLGTAEGIYGGWGNFGAAAAALTLPLVASAAGGSEGWRWAVALTGVLAALYGVVYLKVVRDTPDGVPYARARKAAALEVSSPGAVRGLIAMSVPLGGALVLIAWRIWKVGVISSAVLGVAIAVSMVLLGLQIVAVLKVNGPARRGEVPAEEQYPFRSVAVLAIAYMCTFGSELAAVSFLPEFFEHTWGLSTTVAGAAASTFAVMNLVSRPAGGIISDVVHSRRRWLAVLLGGLALGFLVASRLSSSWPLGVAIALVLGTSLFAQAGNGAVYAIVPQVKKRVSGQVAGLAGAYGNVGGIVFLSTLLFLSPQGAFMVMAVTSAAAFLVTRWLVEPATSHAGAAVPVEGAIRATTEHSGAPSPALAGAAGT
jgi:NNP family nitrate/nitrite transporter-like MFS transporter